MQLVVTIYERTIEAALQALRNLDCGHDLVEIRLDAFGGPADRFRGVTKKPLIFTNRGGEPPDVDFGWIDVEYGRPVRDPKRTVLSFHDFERVPDLEPLIDAMLAQGCAHTKIAVTPGNLRENERILAALRPGLTLFGMGERGLYSRILAPFFGSELAFVSVDDDHAAAPGQLSLERAAAIYGAIPSGALKVFAVVGNPAGHSLSPSIHNPLFREHGVPAAYTIASVESFDEVIEPFRAARLTGMSVTAPFKDDAFAFAQRIGAEIGANAVEAKAVNTLVTTKRGVIADNTDVDGFEILLTGVKGKRAAVIGAGGTGRAAVIALNRAGFDVTVFNRTSRTLSSPGGERECQTRPLDQLRDFDGDVVINTLPVGVQINLLKANTVIEAAYSGQRIADRGHRLLQAQAIRQNELFLKAFE